LRALPANSVPLVFSKAALEGADRRFERKMITNLLAGDRRKRALECARPFH
jgi:hypothetical protein